MFLSLHLGSVPVSADAGHAEAVATGRRRGVGEHVQTDGAEELLVGQKAPVQRHPETEDADERRESHR